ncbi:MAG TPA: hypothetical protein VHW66_08695 [Stellaceae bacterium]|jgi:hypothetical protein|nr:hypothetical protein [Stellaceae bacterium]
MAETTASRVGLAALCLYTMLGLADAGLHLRRPVEYGTPRFAPGRVVVAADAGLFWPVDLVAAALLSEN